MRGGVIDINIKLINKKSYKSIEILLLIFVSMIIFISQTFITIISNYDSFGENNSINTSDAIWATFNLTNNWIDGTRHPQGSIITIEGRLFNRIPVPSGTPKPNYQVQLIINGQPAPFYNTTDINGNVRFIYIIPSSSNVYAPINISAEVTNASGVVEYIYGDLTQYYLIYSNTTSKFNNIQIDKSHPYLTGENIDIYGNLIYNNGSNIQYANINASWYTDGGAFVSSNIHLTDGSGSMPNDIMVPINPLSINNMTLNMTFSDYPHVGFSYNSSPKILVFNDVIFGGLPLTDGNAGSPYTITGQVISNIAPNFPIFNRIVRVVYNGGQVTKTGLTLANGSFSITFNIPNDNNGSYSYHVELVNSAGRNLVSLNRTITIIPLSSTPGGAGLGALSTPFTEFLIFFIPIVSVIAGGLLIYGYFFLKRQKEEAQVASIPLEGKIKNLKILKDSGRIEESLSYLFNAIYITLIDAKYGRKKKDHETIRDFAIISVKELRMKPSIIYPFITKVEEIIYSRPFEISDDDFYTVIDLFSRVYYELTNYNFILNF